MGQISLYLSKDLQKKVDKLAKQEKKSRSAWIQKAIEEKAENKSDQFPDWWWALLGTWEDDRTSEEIIRDIDQGNLEVERLPFK